MPKTAINEHGDAKGFENKVWPPREPPVMSAPATQPARPQCLSNAELRLPIPGAPDL